MKYSYTRYHQLDSQFDPFYLRKNQVLQELVDQRTPLAELDIEQMIDYLSNDKDPLKQYFVTDFLALYKEKIPDSLYEPVLKAGIRHRDLSFNKFFFLIAKRIKGEACFFSDLLFLLKNGTNYEKVMTINSLYWNFGFYWMYVGEPDVSFKKEVEPYIERHQDKINQLMEVLTEEFLKNKNLIVRYSFSKYLPKDIKRYPQNLRVRGEQILRIIESDNLPKESKPTILEFVHIWKASIDDVELGKLFFDELKWRKRNDTPTNEKKNI